MVPLDPLPTLIISWFKRTHWEDKAKYKALSRNWKNKKQKCWYLDKDWDSPPELKIKLAVLFFIVIIAVVQIFYAEWKMSAGWSGYNNSLLNGLLW